MGVEGCVGCVECVFVDRLFSAVAIHFSHSNKLILRLFCCLAFWC